MTTAIGKPFNLNKHSKDVLSLSSHSFEMSYYVTATTKITTNYEKREPSTWSLHCPHLLLLKIWSTQQKRW